MGNIRKHYTGDEKRAIINRIFSHMKTCNRTTACQLEGIQYYQFMNWRQQLGITQEPTFDVVTKIEPPKPAIVEVPKPANIEPPKLVEVPREEEKVEEVKIVSHTTYPSLKQNTNDLVNMLVEASDACIILVKKDGMVIPVIKGDAEEYLYLYAIQGVHAMSKFPGHKNTKKPEELPNDKQCAEIQRDVQKTLTRTHEEIKGDGN